MRIIHGIEKLKQDEYMGTGKNLIKAGLSKAFGKPIEDLVVTTEYVSFDIFDTLVLRNVEKPTDVFSWIDRENAGFFEARVQAEKTARQNATHEDVTLDEIYLNMGKTVGHEEAQRLRALELSTELQMCVSCLWGHTESDTTEAT